MNYNIGQKVILRNDLYNKKWVKSVADGYIKFKNKPLTINEIVIITEIRFGFEEIDGLWSETEIKCLCKLFDIEED